MRTPHRLQRCAHSSCNWGQTDLWRGGCPMGTEDGKDLLMWSTTHCSYILISVYSLHTHLCNCVLHT